MRRDDGKADFLHSAKRSSQRKICRGAQDVRQYPTVRLNVKHCIGKAVTSVFVRSNKRRGAVRIAILTSSTFFNIHHLSHRAGGRANAV